MNLGIIGSGKMGTALISGVIKSALLSPDEIRVGAPERTSSQNLAKAHDLKLSGNIDLLAWADAILLATKPAHIPSLTAELGSPDTLLISIAAGVTLQTMTEAAGTHTRIIRCMPNTPSLIGLGASAYSVNEACTSDDFEFTQQLLSSVGIAHQVPEHMLNAVTGLSGSGPAYIYLVIEALADGGVKNGLPREIALDLATQTVLGASSMVKSTGLHPAILKDQVTSPGGTTIAALDSLESDKARSAFMNAVSHSASRAEKLGD